MNATLSPEVQRGLQRPVWQSPILPLTESLWIHPAVRRMPFGYSNGMVNLPGGAVLSIEGDQACITHDDGATWRRYPLFPQPGPQPGFEYGLVVCPSGTVLLVYIDTATRRWAWDDRTHAPTQLPHRDICCVRSTDEGMTWSPPQKIADFSGSIIHGLVTRRGRVVIPIQPFLLDPYRNAQKTLTSDDEGVTWRSSNIVDVGGHGHHDGGFECTLVQRRDDTLWMLLRTNLDCFWEAFSDDEGERWQGMRPTSIDASSAPAYVTRLASGRLIMAWNRLYPEGASEELKAEMRFGGDCNTCRPLSSWHRHELSIAFSADDGQNWTAPRVVARDKRLAYPTILERRPGEIWLTTRFSQRLALALRESDFVG